MLRPRTTFARHCETLSGVVYREHRMPGLAGLPVDIDGMKRGMMGHAQSVFTVQRRSPSPFMEDSGDPRSRSSGRLQVVIRQ
jgi:hypothetical protein